jgi:hypothetical protein
MSQYIQPRKRVKDETEKESLLRRLEEYVEFEHETCNFSNMVFHETIIKYIEKST